MGFTSDTTILPMFIIQLRFHRHVHQLEVVVQDVRLVQVKLIPKTLYSYQVMDVVVTVLIVEVVQEVLRSYMRSKQDLPLLQSNALLVKNIS